MWDMLVCTFCVKYQNSGMSVWSRRLRIKTGGDSLEVGEATLVVTHHTLLHTGLHLRRIRKTTSGNRGDSDIRKCCPLITYTGTSRLFLIQPFLLVTVLVRFFVCIFLIQGLIT